MNHGKPVVDHFDTEFEIQRFHHSFFSTTSLPEQCEVKEGHEREFDACNNHCLPNCFQRFLSA